MFDQPCFWTLAICARLSKDEYRGLRLFRPWADAHPGKDFGDWIRIVTVNLARDHVSSRLGGARRADDEAPLNHGKAVDRQAEPRPRVARRGHRVGQVQSRWCESRDDSGAAGHPRSARAWQDPQTFLLWHRHTGIGGELDAIVEQFVRDIEELLIEIVDRTITVGNTLDEPTRRLLVTSFFGMANTLAYRMITSGDRNFERELAAHLSRAIPTRAIVAASSHSCPR